MMVRSTIQHAGRPRCLEAAATLRTGGRGGGRSSFERWRRLKAAAWRTEVADEGHACGDGAGAQGLRQEQREGGGGEEEGEIGFRDGTQQMKLFARISTGRWIENPAFASHLSVGPKSLGATAHTMDGPLIDWAANLGSWALFS